MKWALVPEKEGTYSIPPISVSYFNPENRAYHSLQTRPYQLTVLPGATARVPLSMPERQAGTVKQEVKELGIGRDRKGVANHRYIAGHAKVRIGQKTQKHPALILATFG